MLLKMAANTLSEYLIFIDFELQQWLHERASILGYGTVPAFVNTSIQKVLKYFSLR
jgi:hypothetical protein